MSARTGGFSFTEVLAAIAAVALAAIGIAAVYLDAGHISRDSESHHAAEQLATTMAVQIRSYGNRQTAFADSIGVVCDRKLASKDDGDVTANAAACWREDVERELPSGQGTVVLDSATRTYSVIVSWYQTGVGSASYVLRVTQDNAP